LLLRLRGLFAAGRHGGWTRHFGARRQIAGGWRRAAGHHVNVPGQVAPCKVVAVLPSLPAALRRPHAVFGVNLPIKSIAAGRGRV